MRGSRGLRRRGALLAVVVAALVLLPVESASAHPLGNFTINHYHGLTVTPSTVRDLVVIDTAELPTISERDTVDADGDDEISAAERAAFATDQCGSLTDQVVLRVDGAGVPWTVNRAAFSYAPGAAGLEVSRLECELEASVDLSSPAQLSFEDRYLTSRLGWREITAVGEGVDLGDRDVATRSISDELRSYPNDLLTSPLDQRSVLLNTEPGVDSGGADLPSAPSAGPLSSTLASMTAKLDSLVGGEDLTIGVGLLAVGLSLLLGISHAALPGHGKTLMAAYMVGTRGTPKDAVLIGATVTLAHTSGVLVLGLLFSASASFAGETVLAVLGVISGLLVAGIGITLVRGAMRRRSGARVDDLWGHGHGHGHDHGHDHGHGPGHGGETQQPAASEYESAPTATLVMDTDADHTHDHAHDHADGYGHARPDEKSDQGYRRMTLVGMGLAGGLVPSPSALIVLLGAIALGRTVFGIGLVLAYGIGMAATLTTVGYLVAKLPGRLTRLRRFAHTTWLSRLATAGPVLTAGLVLVVGLALAARSAQPLI